ncbi:MAG: oxygenase MpaB family protein [Pseudonocardiaceae bacterium]
MTSNKARGAIQPHEDYGFFGPDSVTWKVWGYATTPVIGLQRAVVVEELDPHLIAAVDKTGANYDRPRTRYDRTVSYFAAVAFADSRSVSKMADVLVKVHSKAIGIEPVSGKRYDANDPASQLWILLTGWHSVLEAYEMYGPGKLTEAEENQYWAECAVAAELQTCDPADVPRTRAGIRAYFEEMRPRLAASEAAQRMMDHLLNAKVVLPPVPLVLRPVAWAVNVFLRAGAIATMPRWMRKMGGVPQSRLTAVAVRPVLRLSFAVLHRVVPLKRRVLALLAPSTLPVVEPIWHGLPPVNPEVLTPAEARERYGYAKPVDAHRDLRARQATRVFGEGQEPSDDGLIESQKILGALA